MYQQEKFNQVIPSIWQIGICPRPR